jgi:hypothetical protein
MELRITVTLAGVGTLDEDAGDELLDALLARLADVGPVLAQNTETGMLDVTVSIAADDADVADLLDATKDLLVQIGFALAEGDHEEAHPEHIEMDVVHDTSDAPKLAAA